MTHPNHPDASPEALPRFCLRCGRCEPRRGTSDLCPECGDPLAPQGFCLVCESFWAQVPGTLCPKHDCKLVAEPPPDEFLGDRSQLVTVASYAHPNQANPPRIRLEAEGIPTFLDGERIAGNTLYQVATGGVRLLVPSELAPAARVLLSQTWAPPTILDDDDTDDAWEELVPEPGRKRRAVMRLAILVFLFGPGVITAYLWLSRMFGIMD